MARLCALLALSGLIHGIETFILQETPNPSESEVHVPLTRASQGFYTATISVTGQPSRVLIDTGSGDLWVPEHSSPISATASKSAPGRIFKDKYGSGSVSGTVQSGMVEFAGGVGATCEFGLASQEDGMLEGLTTTDGIWGLAPAGHIEGLVQCLSRQKRIRTQAVSIVLSETGGSLILGASTDGLQMLPMVGNGKSWNVGLVGVSVRRHGATSSGKTKDHDSQILASMDVALLDTGSSGIRAPSEDIERLAWALGAERRDDGIFRAPCRSQGGSQDVILKIRSSDGGEASIALSSLHLLTNADEQGWCDVSINPSTSGLWILGGVFFRRMKSVVLDYENRQVGFIPKNLEEVPPVAPAVLPSPSPLAPVATSGKAVPLAPETVAAVSQQSNQAHAAASGGLENAAANNATNVDLAHAKQDAQGWQSMGSDIMNNAAEDGLEMTPSPEVIDMSDLPDHVQPSAATMQAADQWLKAPGWHANSVPSEAQGNKAAPASLPVVPAPASPLVRDAASVINNPTEAATTTNEKAAPTSLPLVPAQPSPLVPGAASVISNPSEAVYKEVNSKLASSAVPDEFAPLEQSRSLPIAAPSSSPTAAAPTWSMPPVSQPNAVKMPVQPVPPQVQSQPSNEAPPSGPPLPSAQVSNEASKALRSTPTQAQPTSVKLPVSISPPPPQSVPSGATPQQLQPAQALGPSQSQSGDAGTAAQKPQLEPAQTSASKHQNTGPTSQNTWDDLEVDNDAVFSVNLDLDKPGSKRMSGSTLDPLQAQTERLKQTVRKVETTAHTEKNTDINPVLVSPTPMAGQTAPASEVSATGKAASQSLSPISANNSSVPSAPTQTVQEASSHLPDASAPSAPQPLPQANPQVQQALPQPAQKQEAKQAPQVPQALPVEASASEKAMDDDAALANRLNVAVKQITEAMKRRFHSNSTSNISAHTNTTVDSASPDVLVVTPAVPVTGSAPEAVNSGGQTEQVLEAVKPEARLVPQSSTQGALTSALRTLPTPEDHFLSPSDVDAKIAPAANSTDDEDFSHTAEQDTQIVTVNQVAASEGPLAGQSASVFDVRASSPTSTQNSSAPPLADQAAPQASEGIISHPAPDQQAQPAEQTLEAQQAPPAPQVAQTQPQNQMAPPQQAPAIQAPKAPPTDGLPRAMADDGSLSDRLNSAAKQISEAVRHRFHASSNNNNSPGMKATTDIPSPDVPLVIPAGETMVWTPEAVKPEVQPVQTPEAHPVPQLNTLSAIKDVMRTLPSPERQPSSRPSNADVSVVDEQELRAATMAKSPQEAEILHMAEQDALAPTQVPPTADVPENTAGASIPAPSMNMVNVVQPSSQSAAAVVHPVRNKSNQAGRNMVDKLAAEAQRWVHRFDTTSSSIAAASVEDPPSLPGEMAVAPEDEIMALAKADAAAISKTTVTTTTTGTSLAIESAPLADESEPATMKDLSSNDLEDEGSFTLQASSPSQSPVAKAEVVSQQVMEMTASLPSPNPTAQVTATPNAEVAGYSSAPVGQDSPLNPVVNEPSQPTVTTPQAFLPATSATDPAVANTEASNTVTPDNVPGFRLSKLVAAAARSMPRVDAVPVKKDSTEVVSDGGDLLAAEVAATKRSLPRMSIQDTVVPPAVANSLLRLRTSTVYRSQALTDPWNSDTSVNDDALASSDVISSPARVDTPAQTNSADVFSAPTAATAEILSAPTAALIPKEISIKTSSFDIEKAEEQAAKWEHHFGGVSFLQHKPRL